MPFDISRRAVLFRMTVFPCAIAAIRAADSDPRLTGGERKAVERLSDLEARIGGRLGVATLDTGTGVTLNHHADERFPLCSTFKFLAAAAVLAQVDRQQEQLDRRISFSKADLLEYAPITTARVNEGSMTLAELCDAATTVSDNTAGNLILAAIGGPAGLTAYVRTLGDRVTRLDRNEPTLNTAIPGDNRDTTTPRAMVGNLKQLLLGDALSPSSRATLTRWLIANKTGDARLRAGIPAGWRVGDKTGSGANGTTNDIAIVWPPERRPILIAAYLTECPGKSAVRDAALADVARIVTRTA
jgi:beta-lactamase class A